MISIAVLTAALAVSANAQNVLGSLLGNGGSAGNTLGNILSGVANVVYTAPVSLNGTYTYNGVAVSATSSEGGVIANLAGTAVTSGIESKADEYLAKVGIKPGLMKFTFNSADNTFTVNVGSLSIPGTYKVGDGERTVTLTFGKTMQYFCMTGTLESGLNGAKMLFPANKAMSFLKKLASLAGQASSQVAGVAKLADGYDNFRIGFKLGK